MMPWPLFAPQRDPGTEARIRLLEARVEHLESKLKKPAVERIPIRRKPPKSKFWDYQEFA